MEETSTANKSRKMARFIASFSPATRAAFVLVLPFALVDAIHYSTAGTAVIISLPVIALLYVCCGALAAHFSIRSDDEMKPLKKTGFRAGVTLWTFSTTINVVIGMIAGALSLGVTILLGIPYLILCGPVHLLFGGLAGMLGASIYFSFYRRLIS